MSDAAFQLLAAELNQHQGQGLWVVDENIGPAEISLIHPSNQLRCITNRVDIATALESAGFTVLLSDFDFSDEKMPQLDIIYYRVSKEKAIVHHVINSAARKLTSAGRLVLAGFKNEGIKTYSGKAVDYLGELEDKQKGQQSAHLSVIRYHGEAGEPLDDRGYAELVEVMAQEYCDAPVTFYSKPGVYGWNKIDQGSAFLVGYLPKLASQVARPNLIVDLGCGFGYLSVMASQHFSSPVLATDNNVASVRLCEKNLDHHSVDGEVVLADCAKGVDVKADLLLCNPPFHRGFDVESDLTDRFLQAAKRLLAKGGVALFVVSVFIPLEKKAERIFDRVEQVDNNRSFKLVLLSAAG